MHYGVGSGNGEAEYRELGMVIWNSNPRKYIINVGDDRVAIGPEEILKLARFRERCLASGLPFPNMMKQADWDTVVRNGIEGATLIEPPEVMRTSANELEMLEQWLGAHIISAVRTRGQAYLEGKEDTHPSAKMDVIRVRVQEQRIYFKWEACKFWALRTYSRHEAEQMRKFVAENCTYHAKEGGLGGIRGWWRCTHSIAFDVFKSEIIGKWLDPEQE
jgi:hypothetical protein